MGLLRAFCPFTFKLFSNLAKSLLDIHIKIMKQINRLLALANLPSLFRAWIVIDSLKARKKLFLIKGDLWHSVFHLCILLAVTITEKCSIGWISCFILPGLLCQSSRILRIRLISLERVSTSPGKPDLDKNESQSN